MKILGGLLLIVEYYDEGSFHRHNTAIMGLYSRDIYFLYFLVDEPMIQTS